MPEHVARRHRDRAAVVIETVVDDLRGGLRGPWHDARRGRVGLEHDVDLRRVDCAIVLRVLAGDGLQEDALGHAHALVLGELDRGHHLAARNAGHVRDDGLDLGNAVFLEELLDRRAHGHFPFACALAARPKAANSARENGFFITCHSGCHCTASAKPGRRTHAEGLDEAIRRARQHVEAGPEPFDSLCVQRIDRHAVRSRQLAQDSARHQLDLVRRPVLHLERSALVLAMVTHPGLLLHLLPERATVGDVHLLESPADREQWHAGLHDMRNHRQRGRVAVRIVHRTGVTLGARVMMRLDIRRAAGQENAVNTGKHHLEVHLVTQRRYQHRYRVRRVGDCADVFLAHAVERMRPEDSAIRGNADQWFALSHV